LAADIGLAAEEWGECSVIPEFPSDIPTVVCVHEDATLPEVLPMDPVSLEHLAEAPEMVQPGSLDANSEILELTTLDSISNELVEPVDPINGEEIYYAVAATSEAATQTQDDTESEATVESGVADGPRMSVTASTFSWTFGEYAITAENFRLELFVASESDQVESTAIDVSVVDQVGETNDSEVNADPGADPGQTESNADSESAEQAAGESVAISEEEADVAVAETGPEIGEAENQSPPEVPEILPSYGEETTEEPQNTEELQNTETPADESAESTVATAVENELDVSEAITVETTAGTTVNIQVTVNVGEPALGETESGESSESEAEPHSEAELTLDVIEEVLNDDGFVLVAFPADDLQAVLNGEFDAAFFDEIVLLEAPPETTSEEVVENELPEAPAEETLELEEAGACESENTEAGETDTPETEPETPPVVAEDPLANCEVAEEEEPGDLATAESATAESGAVENEPEGEVGAGGEEDSEEQCEVVESDETDSGETGETETETSETEGEVEAGGEEASEGQSEAEEGDGEIEGEVGTGGVVGETESGEVAEPVGASAVCVVGELYGFVQIMVGDMPWSELHLSADTLTIISLASQMVFGGFDMVLMNQASDGDSELAIAEPDEAIDIDSEADGETDLLLSGSNEQDIDDAIGLWDPLEMCLDVFDGVLA
jgi:hypothetical protein